MDIKEVAQLALDGLEFWCSRWADMVCRDCSQIISRGEVHKKECVYHKLVKIVEET